MIITSGQAVVLHKLAIMSKDGDWIVREDEESLNYIIKSLEEQIYKERRYLMKLNKERLNLYINATKQWSAKWPDINNQIVGKSLSDAHKIIVQNAEKVLPFSPHDV